MLEAVLADSHPLDPNRDKILMNMDFCKHPVPGVNHLKNFNHSYWHKFILTRFGRRRFNFLTEDDVLETNAVLRNL